MPGASQATLKRLFRRLNRLSESDEAFARRLVLHLERFVDNDNEPKWAATLRQLDYRKYARSHGIEALRSLLDEFSSDELKAYAKDRGIVQSGIARLSKGDIVNRIVVAADAA